MWRSLIWWTKWPGFKSVVVLMTVLCLTTLFCRVIRWKTRWQGKLCDPIAISSYYGTLHAMYHKTLLLVKYLSEKMIS